VNNGILPTDSGDIYYCPLDINLEAGDGRYLNIRHLDAWGGRTVEFQNEAILLADSNGLNFDATDYAWNFHWMAVDGTNVYCGINNVYKKATELPSEMIFSSIRVTLTTWDLEAEPLLSDGTSYINNIMVYNGCVNLYQVAMGEEVQDLNLPAINTYLDKDYNPYNFTPLSTFAYWQPTPINLMYENTMRMCGNAALKIRCLKWNTGEYIEVQNDRLVMQTDSLIETNTLRFGFYIYLDGSLTDYDMIYFLLCEEATLSEKGIGLIYRELSGNGQFILEVGDMYSVGFASYTLTHNIYTYVEVAIDLDEVTAEININGYPLTWDSPPVLESPPMTIDTIVVMINGDDTGEGTINTIFDNVYITSEIDKNLFLYRGFDTYTEEVPPAPTPPESDIIFWWSGEQNEYGLPRVDYYGAKDYLNCSDGMWPFFYTYAPGSSAYPELFISTSDPPVEEFTASLAFEGDYQVYFSNTENVFDIKFSDVRRVGMWTKVNNSTIANIQPMLVFRNIMTGEKTFGFRSSGLRLELYFDYNRTTDDIFSLNTWYFVEASIDDDGNVSLYSNGALLNSTGPTSSLSSNDVELIIVQNPMYVYVGATGYINNIIVSSNPDINFYEEGYHLLTEYPKE
jgi:hypothetical protein